MQIHIFRTLILIQCTCQWRIQGFPEGAPTPERVLKPIILQNYSRNCMKIKEFGLERGCSSLMLLCIRHCIHTFFILEAYVSKSFDDAFDLIHELKIPFKISTVIIMVPKMDHWQIQAVK